MSTQAQIPHFLDSDTSNCLPLECKTVFEFGEACRMSAPNNMRVDSPTWRTQKKKKEKNENLEEAKSLISDNRQRYPRLKIKITNPATKHHARSIHYMLTRKFHSFKLVSCFMLALKRKLSMAEGKYYPISFPIAAQEQEAAAAKKRWKGKEKQLKILLRLLSLQNFWYSDTLGSLHSVLCAEESKWARDTKKIERQLVNCNMKSWQSPKKSRWELEDDIELKSWEKFRRKGRQKNIFLSFIIP